MKKTIVGTDGQRLNLKLHPRFWGVEWDGGNKGKLLVAVPEGSMWLLTGVVPQQNRQALCDLLERFLESDETRLDLRTEPLARSETETKEAATDWYTSKKTTDRWSDRLLNLSTDTDYGFLAWIHDRLIAVNGDNPDIDFLYRLRSIIDKMKDGAAVCVPPVEEKPQEIVELGSLPIGAKYTHTGGTTVYEKISEDQTSLTPYNPSGRSICYSSHGDTEIEGWDFADTKVVVVSRPEPATVELGSLSVGAKFRFVEQEGVADYLCGITGIVTRQQKNSDTTNVDLGRGNTEEGWFKERPVVIVSLPEQTKDPDPLPVDDSSTGGGGGE